MEKILANQNAAKKSNNITGSSFRAELARQEAERLNAAQAPEKTTVDDVAAPEQGQSQPVTSEQSESHKQSVEEVTDEAQKPEAQVPETVEAEPEDTEAAQSEQSVLSQLQSLDPEKRELVEKALAEYKEKSQQSINKRIGKEIRKREALEEKLKGYEPQSQVSQPIGSEQTQQAQPIEPFPENTPVSKIDDIGSLIKVQKEAKAVRSWASELLEDMGTDSSVEYQGKTYTKDELRGIRRSADNTIDDLVPQRAAFLNVRNQAQQMAFQKFPWMKDKNSPEAKMADLILRNSPWLKGLPNAELALGYQVEGVMVKEGHRQPTAITSVKPAPKALKPSQPTSLSAASGAGSGTLRGPVTAEYAKEQQNRSENETIASKKTITARDFRAILKQRELARNNH